MSIAKIGRHIGNRLYKSAFPIYRPLYSMFKGFSDKDERTLLRKRITAGAVVVDAGANVGIYSRFLAQCVGTEGRVHCFEPNSLNFNHLIQTVADWPNVYANQMAVGDCTGDATLFISDALNVDHRTYSTKGEPRSAVSIHSTKLDDYFQPGSRVDLVKLDIQGFELHALRGSERILADNPGILLLIELWPYGLAAAGTSATEVISFLTDRGFALFHPRQGGLAPFQPAMTHAPYATSYINLFAERERKTTSFL